MTYLEAQEIDRNVKCTMYNQPWQHREKRLKLLGIEDKYLRLFQELNITHYTNLILLVKGKKLHPNHYTGSGRWTRYSDDKCKYYCQLLTQCEIPFNTGNDAPKGGFLGNWVSKINIMLKPHLN